MLILFLLEFNAAEVWSGMKKNIQIRIIEYSDANKCVFGIFDVCFFWKVADAFVVASPVFTVPA